MLNQGYFLISLDFELQWGRFDKVELNEARKQELNNTIELIPQMLHLFESYNIAATWASVGMLFNKNIEDWNSNLPKSLPEYTNTKYSPYKYFESINKENIDNCFFAIESLRQIANSKKQEIASHTYSHFYCFENGQKHDNFIDDLQQAKKKFREFKKDLDSLVFPRNQFNQKYYTTCSQFGLQAIRTNPKSWYWNVETKENIFKRTFRFIDTFNFFSYTKCVDVNYFLEQNIKPFKLPSSRFLRNWTKNKLLNFLKLQRIFLEMKFAAKYKKYYHLWWHPENFGNNPTQCLQELEAILKHYKKLNDKYNFKSESMSSFAKLIQLNK